MQLGLGLSLSSGSPKLSLGPGSVTIAANGTQTFTGSAGKTPYSYTSTGVYGSVNSSTGLYTANGRGGGSDTVTVTDALGATATATVTVSMWTPTLLSGKVLWLDPAQNLTQVSNRVSAWNDSSGSGDANRNFAQATAGKKPLYTASDVNFNNHPTVQDDDGARILSSGTWGATYTQPVTILVAATLNSGRLFDSEAGRLIILNQTNWAYYGGTTVVAGNIPVPSTQACAAVYNGASSHLYVKDATTANANGNPGSDSLSQLDLFQNTGGGGGAGDVIAELIVVNGIVSATDRKTFFWYCGQKYGLTVTGT